MSKMELNVPSVEVSLHLHPIYRVQFHYFLVTYDPVHFVRDPVRVATTEKFRKIKNSFQNTILCEFLLVRHLLTCFVSFSRSMICKLSDVSFAADSLSSSFSCSMPDLVVTFCVV